MSALIELKGHGGIVDGELSWAELTVHHTADAAGDVFQVVDWTADDVVKTFTIASGVTAYTVTAGGDTTTSITTKTKTAKWKVRSHRLRRRCTINLALRSKPSPLIATR